MLMLRATGHGVLNLHVFVVYTGNVCLIALAIVPNWCMQTMNADVLLIGAAA